MKIVLLHNAASESDGPDTPEVLAQVDAVEAALKTLGHSPRRLPCTLNLEVVEESLASDRPALVFNLVRSLAGSDRLAHLAAVLLDDLELPYTGAPAATLHLTCNKPRAKARMRAAGLPTPDWLLPSSPPGWTLAPPYIIKAIWEHASLGLDDHAVITSGDGSTIREQIESRSRQLGQPCFAEQYIPGREFHLALIAAGEQPRVLPPAEIVFDSLPPDRPRIVGCGGSWQERTVADAALPRRFEFPAGDAPLLDWLKALAIRCWDLFALAGYAQVDVRVDERGQPWILEVNANPSLAPQGSFPLAAAQAGLPFAQALQWILEDALRPRKEPPATELPPSARARPAAPAGPTEGLPAAEPTRHRPEKQPEPPGSQDQPPAVAGKSRSKPGRRPRRVRGITFRTELGPEDVELVRQILLACGRFRLEQVEQAVALVQRRLTHNAGEGSGCLLARRGDDVVGFLGYDKDPLSLGSYVISWIVIEPSQQGQGIGRMLLEEAERRIAAAGGKRIYVEAMHHPEEDNLRSFYEHSGYTLKVVLEDYYAPEYGKAIYEKAISP